MKLSKRAHQTMIVLLVFGGFIGLMFLSGFVPSTEQRCKTTCSKTGLDSRMVYKYPSEMTAGMRGRGPAECQCIKKAS